MIASDIAELKIIKIDACSINAERLVADPKLGITTTKATNNTTNM
jgi:hypothetical protein